jgi:hypothetical protein
MFFATEFPVKSDVDRAKFVAQAIAWIKGMEHTTLFGSNVDITNLTDEAGITSPEGERLVLKEHRGDKRYLCGVRHEVSDGEGRIWRSEVTLTKAHDLSAIRSRTQCLLSAERGKLQIPRKPYFITMAIDEGWAEVDGPFQISRLPIYLNNQDIEAAVNAITGQHNGILPIVYISRKDDSTLPFSTEQVAALAHRLGGVAHVVIEPSRRFSVQLMGRSLAKNPYLGAIGICIAEHGIVNQFFAGHIHRTPEDLFHAVYNTVERYVSNRVAVTGADWADIVEESVQQLRKTAETNQFDAEAWFALRDEEIAEKDAKIAELQLELSRVQSESLVTASSQASFMSESLLQSFGSELYPGELSDRVRKIIVAASSGDISGLDERSRLLAEHISRLTRWSGGASQLEARIKAAGKDSKADARLLSVLKDVGFKVRPGSGHPVLIAEHLSGIPQQTLSASSSDHRAGRNASTQIVRDLGLTSLRD